MQTKRYFRTHEAAASSLRIYFFASVCYDIAILNEGSYPMDIDVLAAKLERINVLAELLLTHLIGNPQAQVLSEIIIETSELTWEP